MPQASFGTWADLAGGAVNALYQALTAVSAAGVLSAGHLPARLPLGNPSAPAYQVGAAAALTATLLIPGGDETAAADTLGTLNKLTLETTTADDAARSCMLNSFTGKTKVLLASGAAVAISKIKVGQKLRSTDPYQHVTASQRVVKVIRHHRRHAMAAIVLVTGAAIQATSKHPLWDVTTHKFTYAAKLRTGDRLLEPGGHTVAVRTVRHYTADLTAYNLDVSGIHTYYAFAGAVPVLVHNSCGIDERIISSEATVSHNSAAVNAQPEGSGFSGVYDPATGRFEARLSSEPNNLVSQFGGHGVINREVFDGSSSCRSMADAEKWWSGLEASDSLGIDLSQSLVIASLGPDMPIILDYRLSPDSPRVLYLGVQRSGGSERVIWREVAPDIETLMSRLELLSCG